MIALLKHKLEISRCTATTMPQRSNALRSPLVQRELFEAMDAATEGGGKGDANPSFDKTTGRARRDRLIIDVLAPIACG